MDIPAIGKHIGATGINIFRLATRKAVEQWSNNDALCLMQQLGVVPVPGQANSSPLQLSSAMQDIQERLHPFPG